MVMFVDHIILKRIYRKLFFKFSLVFFALILLTPQIFNSKISQITAVDPETVDYIFCNTNIITIDDNYPLAEAIAIKNGFIIDVGDTEHIIQNYRTELENNTMDLNGLAVMPGIIDGHTHLIRSELDEGFQTLYGAQQIALAFGYTTLIEKSFKDWNSEIQPILDAEQNNELLLRINIFPDFNLCYLDENNESIVVELWYLDHDPILDNDRMLRVPGIKIFADGAYGNRGIPAMSIPYTPELLEIYESSSLYGDLYFEQYELEDIVKTIHDRGFSCAFHAMGDRAIETVLNSIEFALDGASNDNYRHQIEHNSFFRGDLITKANTLRTLHSVRGYFPTYWQDEDEGYYNSTILEWYANRYSLPSEGVHAFLETDFAWYVYDDDDLSNSRNIKPFLHLWGLVTRKAIDENGIIHEPHPWIAEHEITVEQALKMMTLEGAYAVKQEDYCGSLEVGKFADLIVLTDDPLTIDKDDLKGIQVMLTMVGGEIKYMWHYNHFPGPYQGTSTSQFGLNSMFILIISILSLCSLLLMNKRSRII
ncbi:MAG: amidohydrolase family protein [Asgard group archaeon]|nr:amidohydrolase family protein [Asgard group archaeon]